MDKQTLLNELLVILLILLNEHELLEVKNINNCNNCILCKPMSFKKEGFWVLNKEVTEEEFKKVKEVLQNG